MIDINGFYELCKTSSEATFGAFTDLLTDIEGSNQAHATGFLLRIYQHYQTLSVDERNQLHFNFVKQTVKNHNDSEIDLLLLDFPSTYTPEEWSYTFYEGLNRYPKEAFSEKRIIEVGCGNGWITIALALRFKPEHIVGLDINPNAIICSKLNAVLNAIDSDGSLVLDDDNVNLLDRIHFAQSDLLTTCLDTKQTFDCIIGCIPQVLRPELSNLQSITNSDSSDEFLHSLSNYCEKQGYIEDEFGLGLIAKALEQAITIIKPHGKVILNLGGRPGEAVLKHMIKRRGFEVKKIWQTRVAQAADTDIKSLVDIENTVGHRFEFYMNATTDVAINATTALAFAENGGHIYHSVSVFEATLVFPQWIKQIFTSLQSIDDKQLLSAINLAPEPLAIAEERTSFIAKLSTALSQWPCFPYEQTTGMVHLKQDLAKFISAYYFTEFKTEDFLVAPSRADLIQSLLTVFEFDSIMVNESMLDMLPFEYQKASILAPCRIDLCCELALALKPALIITRLESFEQTTTDAFERLLAVAKELGCFVVLDISESFELSSSPLASGIFQQLQKGHLPDNVSFICGLINNKVYHALKLSFMLSNNLSIQQHLSSAAELTYSRTPFVTQIYYTHLLDELLFFQRKNLSSSVIVKPIVSGWQEQLKSSALTAFAHPAITGNQLAFDDNSIRLDYGENELASPQILKTVILESFLRFELTEEESDPSAELAHYLANRYEVKVEAAQFLYGHGVAPLFFALAKQCQQEGAKMFFASGAYGYFVAAAQLLGIETTEIGTGVENQFKLTISDLEKVIQKENNAWLFINLPIVNPTGALYTENEFNALLAYCAQNAITLIIDTAFAGLEFTGPSHFNMQQLNKYDTLRWFLLGGVAKEFAAGGLRFGFCASTLVQDNVSIKRHILSQPHWTLEYAIKKLYQRLNADDRSLADHLNAQKALLKQRAKRLMACLEQYGWEVLPPSGGLFLVAKPTAYIENDGVRMSSQAITEALFMHNGLAINNDIWTGIKDYCRFVLSVDAICFEQAIEKIEDFSSVLEKATKS